MEQDGTLEELPQLTEAIRRVVGARVRDGHDVEDLVQETLVKLAASRARLSAGELQGYAIATARNVAIEHARRDHRRRRHIHRMVEYTSLAGPEELTLRAEETDALAVALERLRPADRALLLAHEVDGSNTATLADAADTTPGAIAVRLARARAELRLEFLLAFRHVTLEKSKCRSVLLSLSAGDLRRQQALGVDDHLRTCRTCAALSQPLVERRRSIAGLLPLLGLGSVAARARRLLHSGKAQAVTAGATVVAAGAIAALAALHGPAPARPASPPPPVVASTAAVPPTTSPVMSGPVALLPVPPTGLGDRIGQPAHGQHALVVAVPADEGFWAGLDDHQMIWVQLEGAGESPFTVRAGQHVTFDGIVAANPAGFAATVGIPPDQAPLVAIEGAHLEVPYSGLTIDSE